MTILQLVLFVCAFWVGWGLNLIFNVWLEDWLEDRKYKKESKIRSK
jgi:hypothetical protein